jgi:hypothetical protein
VREGRKYAEGVRGVECAGESAGERMRGRKAMRRREGCEGMKIYLKK